METVENSRDNTLYDCKYSSKTDAITITVINTDFYLHLNDWLQGIYNFTENKNKNGIVTCTYEEDGKCVISLYYNQTLFIQGKGSRHWKRNIFDRMMDNYELCDTPAFAADSRSSISLSSSASTTTTPTLPSTCSSTPKLSPTSFLGKLVNSLRSPSKRTPIKSQDSTCSTTESDILPPANSPVLSQSSQCNLPVNEETPSTILLEKPAQSTKSKQQNKRNKIGRKNNNQTPMMSDNSNVNNKDHLETSVKQLVDSDTSLTVQELQKSVKLLRDKYNQQSEKTEKLDNEVTKLKATLKTQYEKNEELLSEASNLKKELATSTTKVLLIEEENVKLKNTVSQIAREKSELVTQLIKVQVNSESVDAKIQSVVDNMEIKLAAEMTSLKTTLLKEISELKSQNQSLIASSHRQPAPVHNRVTNQQNDNRNSVHNWHSHPDVQKTSEHDNSCMVIDDTTDKTNSTSMLKVFIAGDSITRRISPSKMSSEKVNVKIKSHSGGRIDTITKSVSEMNRTDSEYMKDLHAVVLHVGTNNISDGESPDSVSKKLADTVSLVKSVCPKAKIIVSSILPRKAEKVVNNVIGATNSLISEMCEKAECHFLDNDKVLVENGRIKFSLFQDSVHLNQSGGKVFGTHISECINSVLGVGQSIPSLVPNSYQQRNQPQRQQLEEYTNHYNSTLRGQNFQYGRNSGRSWNNYNNRNYFNHNRRNFSTNHRYQNSGMEMVYMPVPASALTSYM